jgi:hypothetical protein
VIFSISCLMESVLKIVFSFGCLFKPVQNIMRFNLYKLTKFIKMITCLLIKLTNFIYHTQKITKSY